MSTPASRVRAPTAAPCLAVLGPGLVGSYLGAAAQAAFAIPGPSGRLRYRRIRLPDATRGWSPQVTDLAQLPPDCLVLVTCRTHQVPWPQLPMTALVAQNGLGQLRPVAVCFLALDVDADGSVSARGPAPRLVLARPQRSWAGVVRAWRASGIRCEVVEDVQPAQWEKAILNATVGPLCLATGLGMGAVWGDPALQRLVLDATAEGERIARACGVTVAPGLRGRAEQFFAQMRDHLPSVVRDPGELPAVLGVLLARARTHAIATPALSRIAREAERAVRARLPVRGASA